MFNLKIKSTVHNDKRTGKKYYARKVDFHSVILAATLVKLGIVPNKSNIVTDQIFQYIPDQLINHFIREDFDSDGTINVNEMKISMLSGSTVFFRSFAKKGNEML